MQKYRNDKSVVATRLVMDNACLQTQ